MVDHPAVHAFACVAALKPWFVSSRLLYSPLGLSKPELEITVTAGAGKQAKALANEIGVEQPLRIVTTKDSPSSWASWGLIERCALPANQAAVRWKDAGDMKAFSKAWHEERDDFGLGLPRGFYEVGIRCTTGTFTVPSVSVHANRRDLFKEIAIRKIEVDEAAQELLVHIESRKTSTTTGNAACWTDETHPTDDHALLERTGGLRHFRAVVVNEEGERIVAARF